MRTSKAGSEHTITCNFHTKFPFFGEAEILDPNAPAFEVKTKKLVNSVL